MVRCMRRTNIYLTEEQQRALDARARTSGTSRSAVLRSVVDDALATGPADHDDLDAVFGELADHYGAATAALFDADDDLRID